MTPNARAQVPVPSTSERDLTLDAWRGFSVLLVICYHAVFYRFAGVFQPAAADTGSVSDWLALIGAVRHGLLSLVVYAGPLGVKFFFVISGYIITKIMLTEHQRSGTISMRAFYVRRACRILPPLWVFLTCVFAARYAGWIQVNPRSFLFALSFLCNTSVHACYSEWFLVHLWSLSLEEQFYLIWPLVVALSVRRALSWVALLFLIGFLAVAQFSLLFVGEFNNGLSFACIAAGALYASSARIRKVVSSAATAPAITLAILLLFGRPLIPLLFPGQFRLHDLLTPALISFVIFSSFERRAVLETQLLVRALAKVGLISYGLYIWQQLFLASPERYLKSSVLTHASLLIPTVLISYFLIEKPFIRLGSYLSVRLRVHAHTEEAQGRGQLFRAYPDL